MGAYELWEQDNARRVRMVAPRARDLLADFATAPLTEDLLCARLGALCADLGSRTGDEYAGPDHVATALTDAATAALTSQEPITAETVTAGSVIAGPVTAGPVIAGSDAAGSDAAGLDAAGPDAGPDRAGAWRVLSMLAGILPAEPGHRAREAVGRLGTAMGRLGTASEAGDLPDLPGRPGIAGPARWTCDRYGSRFAILAEVAVPDGPVRCYLWDVDGCGFRPVVVHSGYYASPEEGLAAWQVAVGAFAAGGTGWRGADDFRLLDDLLPEAESVPARGAESAERLAEHHRSRRLAELLRAELLRAELPQAELPPGGMLRAGMPQGGTSRGAMLRGEMPRGGMSRAELPRGGAESGTARLAPVDTDAVAADFAGTLSGPPDPDRHRAAAQALAGLWPAAIPRLYGTCSPHRVAHVVRCVGEEFEPGFAADVLALLPEWVTWLGVRSGSPPELVDRVRSRLADALPPDPAVE